MLRSAFLLARFSVIVGLVTVTLLVSTLVTPHPNLTFQDLRPFPPPIAWRSTDTNKEKLLKEAALAAALDYSERIAQIPKDFRVEQFNTTLQFAIVSVDYDRRPAVRFLVHGQPDGRWRVIATIISWRFNPLSS